MLTLYSTQTACVKLWSTEKFNSEGKCQCLRVVKIFEKEKTETPVTSLAVREDGNGFVVGLQSGIGTSLKALLKVPLMKRMSTINIVVLYSVVMLFSGDLVREKRFNISIIDSKASSPVTSLKFLSDSTNLHPYTLFVSYNTKLMSYTLPSLRATELESLSGSDYNCTAITDNSELVLGQESGMSSYSICTMKLTKCYGH